MRNVLMIRCEPGLVSIPVENDIIWAALRTLRIGGHSSIGSPDSRTVGSEPGSSRGLGGIAIQSDSRRHLRSPLLMLRQSFLRPPNGHMKQMRSNGVPQLNEPRSPL
jgi:hypothetical protein